MAIALLESEQTLSTGGELSDDQMMVSFGRGDRSAFDVLVARYKQPLNGYLVRNCGNEASMDELFQDIWLKVVAEIQDISVDAAKGAEALGSQDSRSSELPECQ
jgi:hypothetical protein